MITATAEANIETIASWYDEKSSPNATVALMSTIKCPDCLGDGKLVQKHNLLTVVIPCDRCHGDGMLTNQIHFSENGLTCAASPDFLKEHGLRLGLMIEVWAKNNPYFKAVLFMNDYMARNQKGRGLDFTKRAFREIADPAQGLLTVGMRVLG